MSRGRPFYAEYADAYDLLVADPVEPWVEAVARHLVSAGFLGGVVLDAGCGTGRHAAALAARGYRVDLADAAPGLLTQAIQRNPGALVREVDLCTMAVAPLYQAVMCRGVLNDMVTDAERTAALASFAAALRAGGLLLLDVRERDSSRHRADGVARSRTVELGTRGQLTFTSTVVWRDDALHVTEEYELRDRGGSQIRSVSQFVMRPWSIPELLTRLDAAGFGDVHVEPGIGRITGDRLFVTARNRRNMITSKGPV